jgi:DNA-binding FrmR family transcriptional regulator
VPGYDQHKDQHLASLRRIEGQVRGLQRMIGEDTYCIDVITQVAAVNRALQRVAIGLVREHLEHCVANAVREGGPEAQDKLDEATAAVARLLRS